MLPAQSLLLHAIRNQRQGRQTTHKIDDATVTELDTLFGELGRITLETFTAHRLPLLNLPTDILAALRRGDLAYQKNGFKTPSLQDGFAGFSISANTKG